MHLPDILWLLLSRCFVCLCAALKQSTQLTCFLIEHIAHHPDCRRAFITACTNRASADEEARTYAETRHIQYEPSRDQSGIRLQVEKARLN